MSHRIKVGDRVEALDDNLDGVVVGVDGGNISLEDDDGFVHVFQAKDLVVVNAKGLYNQGTSFEEIEAVKSEKEIPKKPQTRSKLKKQKEHQPVIDLHIEKLVENTRGLSNFDMLNIQLNEAKRQLEFAIQKRIQRIVFIHGVGEGVLKMELYTLLRRYDNIKFYDADYRDFGYGATEVRVYQTPAI